MTDSTEGGAMKVFSQLTALEIRRIERSCFIGLLLAAFAYGSLVMIILQVMDVLILRPKRGRIFWGIVIYTCFIFLFSTFAIGGRFKFAEMMYIDHKDFEGGYLGYTISHMDRWENVLNAICLTLLPWIADLLIFYRLFVLWNYQWWILALPIFLYLGRMAVSIPILIITTNVDDLGWAAQFKTFQLAYYSISLALNIVFTSSVWGRLHLLRGKAEQALGKLQSVYYTSLSTTLAESCCFFTVWSLIHLTLLARKHWMSEVFQQPLVYLNAIGRMLIILRMAQNRAWTRDLITASSAGILDWQVSSTHSIPLHEAQSGHTSHNDFKKLPKQFRDEVAPF